MKKLIVGMVLIGAASLAMAAPQTVDVEVVFKDHWGKPSEPVYVSVPVGVPADKSVVDVPNPSLPSKDLLKIAVVKVYPDGSVDVIAEEHADQRVVGIKTYSNSEDPGQVMQLPAVEDLHPFSPHSLAVGDKFDVAAGQEVLSTVRRVR